MFFSMDHFYCNESFSGREKVCFFFIELAAFMELRAFSPLNKYSLYLALLTTEQFFFNKVHFGHSAKNGNWAKSTSFYATLIHCEKCQWTNFNNNRLKV